MRCLNFILDHERNNTLILETWKTFMDLTKVLEDNVNERKVFITLLVTLSTKWSKIYTNSYLVFLVLNNLLVSSRRIKTKLSHIDQVNYV